MFELYWHDKRTIWESRSQSEDTKTLLSRKKNFKVDEIQFNSIQRIFLSLYFSPNKCIKCFIKLWRHLRLLKILWKLGAHNMVFKRSKHTDFTFKINTTIHRVPYYNLRTYTIIIFRLGFSQVTLNSFIIMEKRQIQNIKYSSPFYLFNPTLNF